MPRVREPNQPGRKTFADCRAACVGRNKRSALRRMGTDGIGILGHVELRCANSTYITVVTDPLRSEFFVKYAG
jgi:hypothetical protein